jgi:hypothetical protein
MKKQLTDLEITPKRLGLIGLPNYCPRCYWYLLRQKFHPPFDHFGGAIFKQMEQAQMAVVGSFLDRDGSLPKEFAPFCDVVGRTAFPRNWRRFRHRLNSGIVLYGEPDEIFSLSDTSIAVVDHKTANAREGKDPLIGCYRTQIIGYSLIAECGLKLGQATKGGLFYWSAQHKDVIADPDGYYHEGSLWMSYKPTVVPFEIDYEYLNNPLEEAVRLWCLSTPPDRTEGCEDCEKLDALFGIEMRAEEILTQRDSRLLRSSYSRQQVQNAVLERQYREFSAIDSALRGLESEANALRFADDGLIANWDEES